MKKFVLLIAVMLSIPSTHAFAKIHIFACEPEWASLAQEIGGEFVKTYSATHAQQDPHYIRARPSLMAKMRKSDLVFCSGADLESGWLPILLQKSGSADVQPNGAFHFMATDVVPLLDQGVEADRSHGHIHTKGNPHVHLNPHHILLIAKALNTRLQKLAPDHAQEIDAQYHDFVARWKKALVRWEKDAAALKGKRIISHHKSWDYLVDWLALDLVGTLESKPGIPPTSAHLETLLKTTQKTPIIAIIRTTYDPEDASEWLHSKTQIPALELAYTVGGTPDVTDLFTLFDHLIERLKGASNAQ